MDERVSTTILIPRRVWRLLHDLAAGLPAGGPRRSASRVVAELVEREAARIEAEQAARD
jgi:hypothetical protein